MVFLQLSNWFLCGYSTKASKNVYYLGIFIFYKVQSFVSVHFYRK